jgi:hypothetical protein
MKSHAIYTAAMTIALATCLPQHASALDKSPVLSGEENSGWVRSQGQGDGLENEYLRRRQRC